MKNLFLPAMLMLALVGCAVAPTPTPIPTQPPPTTTPGAPGVSLSPIPFTSSGMWQTDVEFCKDGEQSLKMDVLYPNSIKGTSAPVAIYLHSRGRGKDIIDYELATELINRGYVVAAVDWRQPPEYKYPTGIYDAKCAVRHLRANADVYHIDPNRIGVWGCSAGGYLSEILALTDVSAGLEGTEGYANQSSKVQAAVSRDGGGDFKTYPSLQELQSDLDAKSLDDPIIAQVSSTTYMKKNSPPMLIMQSSEDTENAPSVQEIYQGLESAGAPVTFVKIDGTGHCGFQGKPSSAERAKIIADFFDANLK